MYEAYWGLACRPFDPQFSRSFFFHSETHDAARLKLRYAVENNLGPGVLCGGIGTGKTAVAELLGSELADRRGPAVFLVYPQMPPADFVAYLAAKLGAAGEGPPAEGIERAIARIEARLRELAEHGRRPTIVVDEAHLIDDMRTFECLQSLLNLQMEPGCSFSLILVGGLSLLGLLERTPQLNERVAVRSVLEPLSRDETVRYVAHRLLAAGATREIFDRQGLAALCELSAGIPRRINRLADLALLVGYADRLERIGRAEIEAAGHELPSLKAA